MGTLSNLLQRCDENANNGTKIEIATSVLNISLILPLFSNFPCSHSELFTNT